MIFGIGYSSLIYLKKFPVNSLKIDRSFIKDIHLNAESASIVGAILALAKKLNYIVVAEGVENAEQLNLLKELECDQMQGFIFSKPIDAGEMTKMLWARGKDFRSDGEA